MGSYSGLSNARAFSGKFFQKYESVLGGSWAPLIGWQTDTDQEFEVHKFLGMVPTLREWAGDRIEKAFKTYSQTVTGKIYEFTLPIDVDDLRREKTGQYMMRVGQTGERAGEHWEILATTLLQTDNPLCFDGQNFFDTDHTYPGLAVPAAQKNNLTSSEVPALNVTTAAAPTRDEMIDVIIGLAQYMYSFKDDKNEPMNGGAKEFALMVPTNMIGAANAAVNVDLELAGARNRLSAQNFKVTVIPNPRLTSTDVVYFFRTDSEAKALILQTELPLQAQYIGAGSEEEFKNNRHLFGGKVIRGIGPGLWQYAIKATLS